MAAACLIGVARRWDAGYSIVVSSDLISAAAGVILGDVAQSQGRPLKPVYFLVFSDALRAKIRDDGAVRNRPVYLALGLRANCRKGISGLWIEQTEGVKFSLRIMNELENRGVEHLLIAIVDDLKGFPLVRNLVFLIPPH